jgi:hypothetical protein
MLKIEIKLIIWKIELQKSLIKLYFWTMPSCLLVRFIFILCGSFLSLSEFLIDMIWKEHFRKKKSHIFICLVLLEESKSYQNLKLDTDFYIKSPSAAEFKKEDFFSRILFCFFSFFREMP